MTLWMALLIPLIGCIISFYYFQKQFVWWEMLLPTTASFFLILIFKFTVETAMVSDTQYLGGMITEAKYYESWSTWVTKECSREVEDGKDSNGKTKYKTEYYDCSECDEYDEYWEVIDNQDHSWNISKEKYNELRQRWNSKPSFVDMHRDIKKHGSCGVDGNAYSIKWNKDPMTSEPSTVTGRYENRVQTAKTSFNMKYITKAQATKWGLYEYPEIKNKYQQATLLGVDSFTCISKSQIDSAVKMFNYFNGLNGPDRKMRLFICFFSGKDLRQAIRQKDYWDGGNKNEVTICIDANRYTGKINWVQAFTWSANTRIVVDLREDLSNMETLNMTQMYHIINDDTKKFKYRDFDDFSYLSVEVPTWEIWCVYILTIIITAGLLYFGYNNEYTQTDDRPLYKK